MSQASSTGLADGQQGGLRDIGFAVSIVFILTVLFFPLPAVLIDIGLAASVALSILVLMVALWIERPLAFSAFPTVLLIVTLLRLALNIATTRLILTDGHEGEFAAGYVIAGFAKFVMSGDFVIGLVVFIILLIVNFVVITKGATRIAEVSARFALDAVPGKQMAIDADLSAGLIDDRAAQMRRRELEEESAFFGAMDGASKFVRGDAIAGLVITGINIVGGILIAVWRHGMPIGEAGEVFTKLSVGDGLVTQIPALIVSLAAGLVIAKGGARGSVEQAVIGQFASYPRAMIVTGGMMGLLALMPGLPFLPFAAFGAALGAFGYIIPVRLAAERAAAEKREVEAKREDSEAQRTSVRNSLDIHEIEVVLGAQLSAVFLQKKDELALRVANMRRKFARQYGFVVPEIQLSDDFSAGARSYRINVYGSPVASSDIPIGDVLVIVGDGPRPSMPGRETSEPAFGLKALWVPETFSAQLKREGFAPVDTMTVVLTHLSEVIRGNLAQLLSYRDVRVMLDRLGPEYKRLLDEIVPAHISHSGLQAVLKLLLAERVSIRNARVILEAIAEIAPHARRTEQIAEHVRLRIAQQICGDLSVKGVLNVLKLGPRWELAFHQGLKRSANGEIIDFEIDPRLIEELSRTATSIIRAHLDKGLQFVIGTSVESRPYVRIIFERLFPNLAVLSSAEIAKAAEVNTIGSLS